jgi:hypothetical protein
MKRLTLLLIAALSLAGITWAQQPGSNPSAQPPGALPGGASRPTITPEEWQELRAAHAAALKANPDVVAENKKLLERMSALEQKLNAAMVKADPSVAPIIAKFEANRLHPGVAVGTPPTGAAPATVHQPRNNRSVPTSRVYIQSDRLHKLSEPGAVAFLHSVSRKAVVKDPKDFRGW